MRKQWIALLLASVLALSLCAIPALAQNDQDGGEESAETVETTAAAEEGGTIVVTTQDGEGSYTTAAGSTMDDELFFSGENDFRYLGFDELRDRVLEGSLSAKMLEESIASIDAMDFTQMHLELAQQLNSLEAMQFMYAQIPVATPFEGAMQGYVQHGH